MAAKQTPDLDGEAYNAYLEHGHNYRSAALSLGIPLTTLKSRIYRHKDRNEIGEVVPDGYIVNGTSTLYNKDGEKTAQWVKLSIDKDRQMEMMREFGEALKADIPREKITVTPEKIFNEDLAALYVITDYHLGQFSWGEVGRVTIRPEMIK